MKTKTIRTVLFSTVFFIFATSHQAWSDVLVLEAGSYDEIIDHIEANLKNVKPQSTQMVFDIDDTLIAYNECDAVKKLKKSKRFYASLRDCDALLTSLGALDLVNQLKRRGHPVLVMTARPYKYGFLEATFKQLSDLRESDGSGVSYELTFETATGYSSDLITIPFKQELKNGELRDKEVAYQKGVSFVSSANKGLALKAFNKFFKKRYPQIVFIDDHEDNIEDLKEAYSGSKRSVLLIHYTEHND
jgi:hydroxymethylpyrimidine pyrophosphatase-like HAD family hydrolase